jgi:hypothetical protein
MGRKNIPTYPKGGLDPQDKVIIWDGYYNAYWSEKDGGSFVGNAYDARIFSFTEAQKVVRDLWEKRAIVIKLASVVTPDPTDQQEEKRMDEEHIPEGMEQDRVDKHEPKAVINMSGQLVEIGVLAGLIESNPYIKICNELEEPIYFSVPELDLLVASLCAVKAEITGEMKA